MHPSAASAVGPARDAVAVIELARPDADALSIDDTAVRRMIDLVDRMEVVDALERWEREAQRGPGGAPRQFSNRALLVAMALSVRYNQGLTLHRFCKVLFCFISPEMRAELGVPDPPEQGDVVGWKRVYRNVRSRFHGMTDLMDPSPFPKNRRLSPAEFEAATKLMTPDEVELCEHRLLWFCNQIIGVTLEAVPRKARRRWTGAVGLDATPIPAFARPTWKTPGRNGTVVVHSADPDAAWYVREDDHRDPDGLPTWAGSVGKKARKLRWAFELSIAIMGPTTAGEAGTFPQLVVGMAPLHKPGHDPGGNAIKLLANMHERRLPAGLIGADRAYTGQKPENFRLPALALGHELVVDYKITDLGLQGTWGGAQLVDGGWYCPSMPLALVEATKEHRTRLIDVDEWLQRLESRRAYAFRPKQSRDPEGSQRLMCPAAGAAPTARCPLKEKSTKSRHTLGKTPIMLTVDVASDPPPVCQQESLTFPPEAGDRYLQPLPHGTPEWHETYAPLRNTVEGVNGIMKDGSYEALADPTKRRVRGIAAQSVLIAFGLFAVNLRKIDTFLELAVAGADGIPRKPRKRRRKTRPIQDFAPSTASSDPPNTG